MKTALIAAIVAFVVAWGVVSLRGDASIAHINEPSHDAYLDRVESSGTVRCGYVNYPPFVSLDPNTHAVNGIMVDITAKIADIIGWKVVWSGETTFPMVGEDLASGKFDVFCGGYWQIALSEKHGWWTGPIFYSGIGAYARTADPRFDSSFDIKKLDDPVYSIAVIDGVAVDRVRALDFPHAKAVSLPNLTGYGEMITQVTTGKADVVLIEKEVADSYMAQNPGKIRRIGGDTPLRIYGMGYEFSYDAPRLRNIFLTALREALYGGVIDRILDAHETVPGMFYRVRPDVVGS